MAIQKNSALFRSYLFLEIPQYPKAFKNAEKKAF